MLSNTDKAMRVGYTANIYVPAEHKCWWSKKAWVHNWNDERPRQRRMTLKTRFLAFGRWLLPVMLLLTVWSPLTVVDGQSNHGDLENNNFCFFIAFNISKTCPAINWSDIGIDECFFDMNKMICRMIAQDRFEIAAVSSVYYPNFDCDSNNYINISSSIRFWNFQSVANCCWNYTMEHWPTN